GARDAVFRSWMNPRAATYRRLNDIPHDLGTAVNVQAMVFGNMGDTSATGVGFTRNPSTGTKEFYGEFLQNAQGEDVVAGTRTPREAVMKVEPHALDQLLHPIFDPKERARAETAAKGLPASPGAATGAVVFTADDAVAWSQKGKRVLLVRMETVPDDIHGMSVAQGIL